MNYTEGRQLNLLKDIGFESPSWLDLSYLLIGVIVLASVAGGGWALWDRAQHDPWLRLLSRVRKRLARAGIDSTPATSPRQLAGQVRAKYGAQTQALHDWLMQLESLRYAATPASGQLRQLRQQFRRLSWPA